MIGANDRLLRQIIWYAIMGLLTILTAFSVAYYVQAKADYRECVDRNMRSDATSQALFNLAEAAEAGGDPKEAEVLRRFRENYRPGALPECTRPPFTREYRGAD